MGVPPLEPTGLLPLGRHVCDLDEIRAAFVDATQFATSTSRDQIYADFLSALEFLREKFAVELVETVWIGGSFTTEKLDPEDIDVSFILNGVEHDQLSGTKRDKLSKLLRVGGFAALDLSVDGFMIVRHLIANPWAGAGLTEEAIAPMSKRGAWDDWWSRHRTNGAKDEPPTIEDAALVRGYLEVNFS